MALDFPPVATGPQALATRFPRLPRFLLALVPAGLLCACIWIYLGYGRFHSFYYWCVLLAVGSVLISLFAAAAWLASRAVRPQLARWSGRASGVFFFLACMVTLYLGAQGVCWRLNELRAARISRTGTHSTGEAFQSNRVLGYAPQANILAGARLAVDGEVVFDYTYRTDAFQRRIVPSQHDDGVARRRALLFFGGSYTFGEGVNDVETLPNQMALRVPEVAIYNYGFSGYGPHQMLARLESVALRNEIPQKDVSGVYLFIPNHVRRVIGAFSTISWARHTPYYEFGPAGRPQRRGSFLTGRPILTRWFDFLKGDHVVQYFGLDFPCRLRPEHLKRTAAIVGKAARLFHDEFGGGDFYVVLYPHNPYDEFDATVMEAYFKREGLQVLDYTDLLSAPAAELFYLPHDRHPRPITHGHIAVQLARDLGFR